MPNIRQVKPQRSITQIRMESKTLAGAGEAPEPTETERVVPLLASWIADSTFESEKVTIFKIIRIDRNSN